MKTDRLYRVEKKDEEKLTELLAECFSQDPLYCKLIPQNEKRKKMLPEIFSCDLDEMFSDCEIYADSKDVNGIILVSDETEPYSPVKYYATQIFFAIKTLMYIIKDDWTLQTLVNFIKGKSYLNSEWTDDIGNERRMHIVYFAVRPSMRGRGIATKLMTPVLDYADEQGLITSLETHNSCNVTLYEHYGFKLFTTTQKNFDLKQFCMVR
ncbi:MAG: GNAT family N-acetyltransferase [Hydrogenoanaerobacterium sp.]